ncbi:AraC family transcriptional regulator [Actinocorallia sp. B10E7]|uniref:AraC family transcriptional regulator n=1 Tax=Actinocorallia sp. B10E7 TaxID=3153558 RepID=UPI00325E3F9A
MRTIGVLAQLVRLAAEHGVDADRCLAGTGLTEADLADPERNVVPAQEIGAVANLLEACEAPGLGLIAGSRMHFTAYGVWGLGILSCPTVRDAADFGLRHLGFLSGVTEIRMEIDVPEYRFVLDADGLPEKVRTFFIERDMAALLTLHRETTSTQGIPRRLHLTRPAPPRVDLYLQTFGIEPVFAADRDFMALDADLLDQPLPMADEYTRQWSEQALRKLAHRRRAGGESPLTGAGETKAAGFREQVRAELLRTPVLTLDEVAARLSVSPRTVNRRLAAEGTCYRGLLQEVRAHLAERMLTEGLRTKDIARRLGYAEPAAFIHAFQRWKGVPPGRYRENI